MRVFFALGGRNPMDGSRFDQIARTLVVGSRRRALKGLVGGVLGGLLARPGAAAVAPGCRGAGEDCAADADCCAGRCSADARGEPSATRCCLPKGRRCERGGQCCSGAGSVSRPGAPDAPELAAATRKGDKHDKGKRKGDKHDKGKRPQKDTKADNNDEKADEPNKPDTKGKSDTQEG